VQMTPWLAILGKILPGLFGFMKPLFVSLFAYFKGRSDVKKNERLKADDEYIRRINDSNRAANDAERVPDKLAPFDRDKQKK
jgi:hypothetical protein